MKAVVFQGFDEPFAVMERPDPSPGPGEIVLEIGRCGICGTDVHLTQEPGYFETGTIIGHEFAGEVVALGRDVEGFKLGDRVATMAGVGCGKCLGCVTYGPFMCEHGFRADGGGFAEYACVAAHASIRLPSSLSMTDGALVEPLAVALHGVRLGNIGAGDRVLVLGPGAIGLSAIYWARRLGARRIAALSRSPTRVHLAEQLGADACILAGEDDVERVKHALGGLPDIVIECVGAVGSLERAIDFVRPNGVVVSLGLCAHPDVVLPVRATMKQVRLVFSLAYNLEEFELTAETLDRGYLEPRLMVDDKVLALADVPDTIAQLRQGRSPTKLHVDPSL